VHLYPITVLVESFNQHVISKMQLLLSQVEYVETMTNQYISSYQNNLNILSEKFSDKLKNLAV